MLAGLSRTDERSPHLSVARYAKNSAKRSLRGGDLSIMGKSVKKAKDNIKSTVT